MKELAEKFESLGFDCEFFERDGVPFLEVFNTYGDKVTYWYNEPTKNYEFEFFDAIMGK